MSDDRRPWAGTKAIAQRAPRHVSRVYLAGVVAGRGVTAVDPGEVPQLFVAPSTESVDDEVLDLGELLVDGTEVDGDSGLWSAKSFRSAGLRAGTASDALARIAHAYLDFARDNPAVYDAMFARATTLHFAAEDTPAQLTAAFAELRQAVGLVGEQDVDALTEVLWAASVSRLNFMTYSFYDGRMLSAVSDVGEFELTDEERDRLVGLTQGGSARLAVRAKIVLALAEPAVVYARVAADLGVTMMTVGKWRKRFEVAGVDGLIDASGRDDRRRIWC